MPPSVLAAAVATFRDSAVSASNLTTYTFSAMALGPAADRDAVIVGIIANSSGASVDTVTVGGQSATQVAELVHGADTVVALFIATGVTGSTGDVVVTLSSGSQSCGVVVWSAKGLNTTASATATDGADHSTDDTASASLSIPANGFAVGIMGGGSANQTYTWTNLTEDVDEVIETNQNTQTGAHDNDAGGTTPTISCQATATTGNKAMALASFGPV